MNCTVRVCPERDIECGRNERAWCATCPNRRAAPSASASEELPPLPPHPLAEHSRHWSASECEAIRNYARAAVKAAKAAPTGPLYTCIGKGGTYELIGLAHPAGVLRKLDAVKVYQAGGRLYYRTVDDFDERMQRIQENKP